jgi:hypothetical protein
VALEVALKDRLDLGNGKGIPGKGMSKVQEEQAALE